MNTLIHLIKTPSGCEFSVPTPKAKGFGLPQLVLPASDKYVASYLLPCDFEKAVKIVEAVTHYAPKDDDYMAWIMNTLQDYRQEEGR